MVVGGKHQQWQNYLFLVSKSICILLLNKIDMILVIVGENLAYGR